MFNWLNMGMGAALGIMLSAAPVYFYGKHEGVRSAAVDALEKSVEVLRKRGDINNEISIADAVELCRHYGLQPNGEAECVRRLREANPDN